MRVAEPPIVHRFHVCLPARQRGAHGGSDEKPLPENLPVKAVIALMAAAAALRAAQAGRASQKCSPPPPSQPPPVSLFLRKLSREGRSTLATVDGVRNHHPDFYPHAQFFIFILTLFFFARRRSASRLLRQAAAGSTPQLFPFKCSARRRRTPDFI